MDNKKIAVIGGDGIGPEVANEAMRVVEKAVGLYGPGISINRFPQGADYFIEQGRLVQDPATGLYVPDGQLIEPSFF